MDYIVGWKYGIADIILYNHGGTTLDKWTTTKSESLVDNHWVKIRKDSVVLPNEQKIDDFYVITINNAAAIVAIDENGNCILKKEYRYCYDRELI